MKNSESIDSTVEWNICSSHWSSQLYPQRMIHRHQQVEIRASSMIQFSSFPWDVDCSRLKMIFVPHFASTRARKAPSIHFFKSINRNSLKHFTRHSLVRLPMFAVETWMSTLCSSLFLWSIIDDVCFSSTKCPKAEGESTASKENFIDSKCLSICFVSLRLHWSHRETIDDDLDGYFPPPTSLIVSLLFRSARSREKIHFKWVIFEFLFGKRRPSTWLSEVRTLTNSFSSLSPPIDLQLILLPQITRAPMCHIDQQIDLPIGRGKSPSSCFCSMLWTFFILFRPKALEAPHQLLISLD